MATNYSPTIVTDGAVFVGDARMPSISEPGARLYDRSGTNNSSTQLLIHGDVGSGTSFADSSVNNITILPADGPLSGGPPQHSTTQSKFNGGSVYFDGNGDGLKHSAADCFNFGTGNFTIDFWYYQDSSDTQQAYATWFSTYNYGTPTGNLAYGIIVERYSSTGNYGVWSAGTHYDTGDAIIKDAWTHVAVVREGTGTNQCHYYVNGTEIFTFTNNLSFSSSNVVNVGWGHLYISESYGPHHEFKGYMDEMRLSSAARWTTNFTPPARRNTLSTNGMMYNGACLNFDGSDDWVDCGSSPITSNSAFSWAAWINPTGASGTPFFLGTTVAGEAMVSYWDSSTGMVRLGVWGADKLISNIAIPVNSWGHTCWTWDGTTLRAYTNGVAAGTATGFTFNIASNDILIGAASASAQEFGGNIADVKLYNVALSAANVKEIYNDSKVIIPSNVSQTNLKGWWPLVDGAGTIAYDGSGNGNDGTLTNMDAATDWLTGQTGAPQLVQGYNRPMLFDGSNDYVQVTSDGSADFANQSFTVAGWINLPDGTPSADRTLFSYDYTSHVNPYYAIQIRFVATGRLYFMWNNGTTYYNIYKDAAVTDSVWHHYACTFTSGSQKIYIDGVQVASATRADTVTYYNQEVWIGRSNYGGYFKGLMNEVVVYNSALTLAQVQVLAATGPNGGPLPPDPMSLSNSSNVVGYWRNDGNVTWTDRSSNSNNGTVTGSPDALLFKQGINGSASTSTGRDGQGFSLKYKDVGAIGFNGSDNLIVIPHSTVFDNTVFSYCSWVYVPGDTTADGKVAHLSNNSAGNGWGTWQIRSSTVTNQLYYQTNNAGTWQSYTMNNYFTGAGWYYICVTHIQGSNPTVYRDAEVFAGTGTVTQDFDFGTDPLYIGCRKSASSFYEFWNGQIANGQYYNRVLSHAEIKQNYNAQKSRFT